MGKFVEATSGLLVPDSHKRTNGKVMREGMFQLEQQLLRDDAGWLRLTGTYHQSDFTQLARSMINRLAEAYWLKNPLISRAVETENNYVFGRGVTISAKDDLIEEVLDDFWSDVQNQRALTGHQAQTQKNTELKLFGNVYIGVFTDRNTGRVSIRTFPWQEITDIITDPDDRSKVLYYKWEYAPQSYDFRSHSYETQGTKVDIIPDFFNDEPKSHTIDNVKMLHVAVNKLSNAKFGNSELYRALDWAKAYTQFLEDWATLVASYSRFAFKLKTTGVSAEVAGNRFSALTEPETPAGSTWVEKEGAGELQPMPQGGPSVSSADGRRFLLMVSAGTGIWEHYFGDPATGNLATSTAMELPMLKNFEARQELWRQVFNTLGEYTLLQSMQAPSGVLARSGNVKQDLTTFGDRKYRYLGDDGEDAAKFSIDFPTIVEKDVPKMVTTTREAANDTYIPKREAARLIMRDLGIDDVDEHLDELFPDDGEEIAVESVSRALERLAEALEQSIEEVEG